MITYGSTTLTSYNSIVKTEVYYYKSTSATSLSGGSWATTKPTWENGKYIWQKIRTVYEDGTHTESDPVNITGQQGATGTAAYSFKLNSSDSIIGKTKDGEYTIKKITFSATYKQGTGAVSAYSGRFKIESTTNGSTWKTEYTSSGNESSKEFTIPDDIIAIKCSLYQNDGTTVLLDIVTVPVVKDGVDAIGLRDSIPYYLASDKDTGITRLTQGWTRYRPQLTAEKKYLWVYYVSRYSEGTTEPELIEIKDDLVHFVNNGDESPIESCVVDIEPVQDLNGYDHPWPAGGGKNILDPNIKFTTQTVRAVTLTTTDGYNFSISGTGESGSGTFKTNTIPTADCIVYPAGTYTVTGMIIGTYHTDGSWYSNRSGTFTSPEDFIIKNGYREIGTGVTYNVNDFISMTKDTTALTAWTPYSNICPITGWTGAIVTRCGKNLLPNKKVAFSTHTWLGTDITSDVFYYYLPIGTYTMSAVLLSASAIWMRSSKATSNIRISGSSATTTPTGSFTVTEANYYRFWVDNVSPENVVNFQLELGSTATDYEPYQGDTYDITFPSEAGTVYGGTLDVTSGVLTVDRKKYTFTGTEQWSTSVVVANRYLTQVQDVKKEYGSIKKCTHFLPVANVSSREDTCNVDINGTYARLIFDTSFSNLDDWKSYLAAQNNAGTPLEAVALLATPITYHLTPQEITSLLGENNIFADTGQTAISYYDNQTSTDPYVDYSATSAFEYSVKAYEATQPLYTKTYTGIIGTANTFADASFYFAKIHPTIYTSNYKVKMKIRVTAPVNYTETIDVQLGGYGSSFSSYDSYTTRTGNIGIYYVNLYRATQAGIETNKKGHAIGFGLRSSTNPTNTNDKRDITVDILELDGCTIEMLDTPVKYADMDGTGSTNYTGYNELAVASVGQNATNNGNTYDRIKYSTIKAAEAIARYNIIVGTSAGYKHLKSGTPWDITYPILYADGALNANATGSSNYLTIPFTVTTTQAITLTPYKPVYIEGTLEGTTFTPVDTTPLTQTVPTSDNGHQYILLGSAYSTTAINLEAEHPIYQFQNGNFVTVAEAASRIGANAENLLKATYAICNTAAETSAKTADCMNFELYEGARIQVTFTNANTASAPTLNVNSTGAKAIYINKTVTSSSNLLLWTAGSKMEFVYDGTGWIAQNVPYALYGTCSTGASTAAKAVTCNEAVICKGTTISVNMTNTNTAANATMNVGSTLAKDIYANGAKLTTNSRFNWRANTTQKFVFDGQVWRMDDDSVKALATAYITEIDDDGIMVHPEDDSNSGWAISDAIQLFKNGISYIKLWIENNIPKIRIGKEDQGHIILDNDSVDIRNDDTVLASFGATSVIGDENDWHQTIAANQITFAKGSDIITYISPDKLYTINAEVADAFYISNYSIRNASDGKLVIGLRR